MSAKNRKKTPGGPGKMRLDTVRKTESGRGPELLTGQTGVEPSLPQLSEGRGRLRNRILLLIGLQTTAVGSAYYLAQRGSLGVPRGNGSAQDCFLPEIRRQYQVPEKMKYVPVVIHRILPSGAEFGGIYQDYVNRGVQGLNKAYARMNLGFYVSELRDVQDDRVFERYLAEKPLTYDQFEKRLEELAQKNAVEHAVNIFILPELGFEMYGSAFGMGLDLLGQKSNNQIFISFDNNNHPEELFPHEMGHIFSLFHPHQDLLAGNKNCDRTGDFLCDTPPDPAQYNEDNQAGCKIDDQCKVVECGNPAYMANPPLANNMMSYYHGCKTSFTPEQEQVITCNAQRHKADLLHDAPDAIGDISGRVRVNCDAAGPQTIQAGIDEVVKKGGGTLQICAGTYHESLTVGGVKSTKWTSDKYKIQVTIEAARDERGQAQEVTVDADRRNSVVEIQGNDYEKEEKERRGRLNLTIRGITFTDGYDDGKNEDMLHSLFDFSHADSVTLDGVTVRDMESRAFAVISLPPANVNLLNSTFSNITVQGGVMFSSNGLVNLNNCSFADNVFTLRTKTGTKPGAMFFVSGEKGADVGFRFTNVHYDRNSCQMMVINEVPAGDTTKLSPEELLKSIKEVTVEKPVSDGICTVKDLGCRKE